MRGGIGPGDHLVGVCVYGYALNEHPPFLYACPIPPYSPPYPTPDFPPYPTPNRLLSPTPPDHHPHPLLYSGPRHDRTPQAKWWTARGGQSLSQTHARAFGRSSWRSSITLRQAAQEGKGDRGRVGEGEGVGVGMGVSSPFCCLETKLFLFSGVIGGFSSVNVERIFFFVISVHEGHWEREACRRALQLAFLHKYKGKAGVGEGGGGEEGRLVSSSKRESIPVGTIGWL